MGWKTDRYFRDAYLNCDNCSYEFDLKLKVDDVDDNDKPQFFEMFKKQKNFNKIDLSDIKTDAYKSFMRVIIPTLAEILSKVIPGPPEVINLGLINLAGKKIENFFKGGWNACKQSFDLASFKILKNF